MGMSSKRGGVSRTGRPRHSEQLQRAQERSVVAGAGLHGAAQWRSRAEVDCAANVGARIGKRERRGARERRARRQGRSRGRAASSEQGRTQQSALWMRPCCGCGRSDGARCSPDSRCRSGFSLRVVPGPHQIALSTTIVYQQLLLLQLRLRLRLRHTGGGVWDSARGGAQRAWSRGTGANWRWMRKGAMDAGGY